VKALRTRRAVTAGTGRRQFLDANVATRDFVAVILQDDVLFELGAPSGFILETEGLSSGHSCVKKLLNGEPADTYLDRFRRHWRKIALARLLRARRT